MAAVGRLPTPRDLPDSRVSLVAAMSAASVALAVTAVYSPKYALAVPLAAAILVLAFYRLPFAVAAFVVLTFPHDLPGVLGLGATVAKPLGLLLVLAWAATVAQRRDARLAWVDRPALVGAVAALVLLAAVSTLWAADSSQAVSSLSRLVQVGSLLVVVHTAAARRDAMRMILWAYLVGSVVTAAYSLGSGAYAPGGRLSGLFDPNYFAASLIPAILIACFIALTPGSARARAAAAAVFCIDVVAFALTQSRGGIVGLCIAFLAAVTLAGSARPRLVAVVLVLTAAALAFYFIVSPAHLRGSFSTSLSGASSGRADEWRIALRMLGNHPLGGVGFGNYAVVEPTYATQTFNITTVRYVVGGLVTHNSYLQTAAELGVPGLVLFVAILAMALAAGGRALSTLARAGSDIEFHARGLVAGAIGLFAAFFFISGQYEKDLWIVLGLLAALTALARASSATDHRRNAALERA